jgi:hypothetical protein
MGLPAYMAQTDEISRSSKQFTNIFTDAQFWVPLTVLLGGLILFHFLH